MPPERPGGTATGVPAVGGPGRGVGMGDGAKVKPFASVATVASGLVTVTSTTPGAWAGAFAVIVVSLPTRTFVAATPPIRTVAPPTKPLPGIVTSVPPVARPTGGAMLAMPAR